jgi:AraC family transcriptional regulator
MDVRIVTFPETRVAIITHSGLPEDEHATALKLVSWKIENRLLDPDRHRHYGLHHFDPAGRAPGPARVDFCLSMDSDVGPNPCGVAESVIPAARCALVRDVGFRRNNRAAAYLIGEWLPRSGERLSGAPLIFHYVNTGPNVAEADAITDVYAPLA